MKYFVLFLLFLHLGTIKAQQQTNKGLNGIALDSVTNEYSFYLSAHFYGGKNNVSGYPASTILGNLDILNEESNLFTVCLGDLFKDIQNQQVVYDKALFSNLKKPLFNAVGNHDVSRGIFEKKYGKTYFSFRIKNDIHLVLDSEKDDGSIKDEQLKLLTDVINMRNVVNIFIYSHRPLWAESDPKFEGVFKENTVSTFGQNFQSAIMPLLKELNSEKQLFWCSGSLGGGAPSCFFYHKENNIHFIQSAIRDLKRDALLKVSSNNGKIKFETVSLTDQTLQPLESYNLDFWRKSHPAEPYNYRLIPLYFYNMFTHRYFWYAVFYTLTGTFLMSRIIKRRKKRSA